MGLLLQTVLLWEMKCHPCQPQPEVHSVSQASLVPQTMCQSPADYLHSAMACRRTSSGSIFGSEATS